MKNKIYKGIFLASVTSFLLCIAIFIIVIEVNLGLSIADLALPLFLSTIAVLFVSIILSKAISTKIVKPLEDINPKNNKQHEYEEIENLISKINRQNNLISRQMSELKRRQVEFKTITQNMSEGLILLDNKSEIISYNKSALDVLGTENVSDGEHFIALSRSRRFVGAVNEALNGRHSDYLINLGQKVYQVFANPVTVEGDVSGVVIVILDITEKEKREDMRREFTSNVSHELKTPLTSILGISELLMNGMIKPEDVAGFAKNIHDEASRLIQLVNDIIKLSRLDEGKIIDENEEIDLEEVVRSVTENLYILAKNRDIEIEHKTMPTIITANRTILYEMIYNLCDNAIKYNKENGKIVIEVFKDGSSAVLTVSDTGIGIPTEHLDRIFERFYRVDKSHSKHIGGTGLGLSIVKHAADYIGACVSVESRENVGTKIKVVFS